VVPRRTSGPTTFFVNGRRDDSAREIGSLAHAVRLAGSRATLKG
jgi:hypothetical protein